MSQRFTLDEAMLPGLAERIPVETDHDALLLLHEAIIPGEGEPAITGPCEIAVELLTDDDGGYDSWRILISTGGPWLGSEVRSVSYLERLPEPTGDGGIYDAAEIIRDAMEAANMLLDWYEDTIALAMPAGLSAALSALDDASRELDDIRDAGEDDDAADSAYVDALVRLADLTRTWAMITDTAAGETAPEPVPEFECCGRWLPRPVPGGPEVRCPGCGDRFVSALPDGWREWASPEGISHAIPPTGPCATCGRGRHDNDQEN